MQNIPCLAAKHVPCRRAEWKWCGREQNCRSCLVFLFFSIVQSLRVTLVSRCFFASMIQWLERFCWLFACAALIVVIGSIFYFAGVCLWGEYHYRAARRALNHHDMDEARRHLEKCLDLWPQSGPIHLMAAQAWRRSGKLETASRHLREAQRLLHNSEETAFEGFLLAAQQNNNEAACKQLHTLLEQGDPRKNLILEALAGGYIRFFRYQEAAACLKEWADSDCNNAMPFFMLAWTYDQMGYKTEVLDLYTHALELAPNNDVIRFNLALALLNRNRAEIALHHWEMLAQRRPDNPVVLLHLARCQRGLGLYDEARTNLDRFLQQVPNSTIALTERGLLTLNSGKAEVAEKYLRRAVELDPYDYSASFALYTCLEHLGREEEAADQRRKFERISAEVIRLNTILNKLIPAMPNNPQLRAEAGALMLHAGRERDGLRLLYSALRLDPKHGPALVELKNYYQRIGDMRAVARLRDAITTGGPIDEPFLLDRELHP